MRWKLLIEYDGTPFAGWQRQEGQPSVQQTLEEAIEAFAGERVVVHGAGRTDAGVHAQGQVAHVDFAREMEPQKIREAINAIVRPLPVSVLTVEPAPEDFSARFSATARLYHYRIMNRRAPPALERHTLWHVPVPLDAGLMHEGAQTILGKHDFTTFRSAACQAKSALKTLDRLEVWRQGDVITIEAFARSFLHNQVRSMVGSLKWVGEGKWPPAQMRAALDARDRAQCGPMAPPQGLCLMRVDYAAGERSISSTDDEAMD
ncbi:MAG TPA: tRNA pseudouridine(38-40) synthase TruA [Alphaproteobacteria bacterium]|nr:tRNA pseudouridine(38-40) synthase TruA [Alphaproteobacteria bacterium]